MQAEEKDLSPKHYTFLTYLLAPMSIIDAAKQSGISEKTARRWLHDPAFKQLLDTAKIDLFRQGIDTLRAKFLKAVQTLDRNMDADQASDQIRSAKTVIEQVIAQQHLSERVAELEAQLAQQEQDLMYHVVFDLRQATKEERATLEAINTRLMRENDRN